MVPTKLLTEVRSGRLESVPVELMPTEPGRSGFACQMGTYRGTPVVQ